MAETRTIMTRQDLLQRFPYASEAFLIANSDPPAGLGSPERKPDPLQALGDGQKVQPNCRNGLVVRIVLISIRRREIDDDNLASGFKHLRDCIAKTLGVDDRDKRVRWEYGCVLSRGPEQTIVKITLENH